MPPGATNTTGKILNNIDNALGTDFSGRRAADDAARELERQSLAAREANPTPRPPAPYYGPRTVVTRRNLPAIHASFSPTELASYKYYRRLGYIPEGAAEIIVRNRPAEPPTEDTGSDERIKDKKSLALAKHIASLKY